MFVHFLSALFISEHFVFLLQQLSVKVDRESMVAVIGCY